MSTAGQQLFNQVTSGLWQALERYRSQAAGTLAALTPQPGFAGTSLDGRLLTALRPDAVPAGDPAVSALIHGLLKLLPNAGSVTLNGFESAPGQPRGLAFAIGLPAAPSALVIALTGDGPQGIAIEFAGSLAGPFNTSTPLGNGWSLVLTGNANVDGALRFPRSAPAINLNGGVTFQINLQYSGDPIELGLAEGPHITLSNLSVGLQTAIDAAGNPKVSWLIGLSESRLSLVADVVSALLGDALTIPMDLNLAADPEQGIAIKGGGLRATLPASISLPGVDISGLDLEILTNGPDLRFAFGLGFTAGLPGFPLLTVAATGLGASFPISTGSTDLGLNPAAIRPTLPSGLGVDLALPVISGGGFLQTTGPGGYGGVLELNLIAITIEAIGLLQLPVNGKPLSFIAIISVEFPFPGIDLSFGFALAGVGGIVGINRRLDTEALQGAVVDGSAARLLFPVNPAAHGPAIIATLGRVFPEAKDHIVVGPMLKVTWGGRIVSMVVAVVVDLPNPLQLVVLGRITIALPDPLAPLVFIQATFVGVFEISPTPSFSLLASLDGSYIAGMPLNGDIFFLIRGGDDPEFVFSAGGFHPRYIPPKGVPANMHRMQLAMTPPGVPGISAEAYFAVTSNSVQFGARLELCDEIAGCGVDGWFAFDALFKWDPVFSFAISCSGGIAVQVLGETLMGISFDLLLEGPAPWHVHGTGSISLFLFSASLDFDATWGSAPAALPPPKDLFPVLQTALLTPAAWIGSPPAGEFPAVSLSAHARNEIAAGNLVHPLGSVTVRQRAVPFDIQISRFQQQAIPAQTWSIATPGAPVRDSFPPGELLNLTDDEKLSRPAFELWNSGADLVAAHEKHSELRAWNTDYETSLIPDPTPIVLNFGLLSFATEALLAIDNVYLVHDLWHPVDRPMVSVASTQPVTVATTDTLKHENAFADVGGFTETLQSARVQFGTLGHAGSHQVVESWEVGL